jgi:hypothetical protein
MKLFKAVVGLRCQGTSYIIRPGQSFSCSDQTLFRPMNISNPQARGVYLPFTTQLEQGDLIFVHFTQDYSLSCVSQFIVINIPVSYKAEFHVC